MGRVEDFIQENDLPAEIETNLRKQKRDRPRFEVNRGGIQKPQGTTKTLYEQVSADENTLILGKSYDFAKEKKNPEEDEKVPFPKFEILYSISQFIREGNYPSLSERKKEQIIDWKEDGVPNRLIYPHLPDDGAKYKQMKNACENSPILSVYPFLNESAFDEGLFEDIEHIVWEENPHQPYTENITTSLIKDVDSFNWDESDVEDIIDVSDDVKNKRGILNILLRFDFHKELDKGTLHMFLYTLKNIYDDLERYEQKVKDDDMEVGEKCVRAKVDGTEFIWQIPEHTEFWGEYTTKDGDVLNPFKIAYRSLQPKIHERMDREADRGNMYAVRELSKFLEDLHSLTLFASLDFHMTVNWRKEEMLGKKSVNRGVSPFSLDGGGEGKSAYITFHRQYLEVLDDISQEYGVDVTINYASADMDPIIDRVEDAEEYQIDLDGELKTTIHHIQQSFAKYLSSPKKENAIESIRRLIESQGKKVGTVSYMDDVYDEDIGFGNSKGREFPFDADAELLVGTPRKDSWQYAIGHLLLHKKFPKSGVYGKTDTGTTKYHFPKEKTIIDFGIEGYTEDSLNQVYRHMVLSEKTDATFRIRNLMEREKDIYIFGQIPREVMGYFSNCDMKNYDSYWELVRSEILVDYVLSDEAPHSIDLPYIPEDLPFGLWRDGRTLKKTKNNSHAIEELVMKNDHMTRKELVETIEEEFGWDVSGRTVKRNSKKNENLVWISGGGRGNPSMVQRSFDLKDFWNDKPGQTQQSPI